MSQPEQARVLVVDDDPAIRALVVRTLQKSGFAVDSARDGVEALACLESGQFDLLVLDLMMPRLDGIGVVDQLTKRNDLRTPKIMIMTAASPSILKQVPAERVARIITKPFDLRTLIDAARDLSQTEE